MSMFANFMTVLTLKYIDNKKQEKIEADRKATKERYAKQWNEMNNAVSYEVATEVFNLVCKDEEGVIKYLMEDFEPGTEEYDKELFRLTRCTPIEKMCEEYTHKKYNKKCYPPLSKMRELYFGYLSVANCEVAARHHLDV